MTPETPTGSHWVHDLDPFAVRFPEGWPLDGIRWYGLAYLAGFAVAALLLHLYFKKGRSPLNSDQQTTLLTAVILGTLVGGRLGYMLLYDTEAFFHNPFIFFEVYNGGMASHGGMIGIVLAVIWFARHEKLPFWRVADIVVTLGPAGVFFGRIANFVNAELWGKPSEVAWAIIFPIRDTGGELVGYTPPCHPSQLYEAALEGLLLFAYLQWRFWKTDAAKSTPGRISAEFLIFYGVVRVLGELFREPDADLIMGLSRGTFYSLWMVAIGGFLWARTTLSRSGTR